MIKLFTDTSANLPLSIIRSEDIQVLSFSYTFNGVPADYNEETEFDGKWFYDLMRKGVEVKTSLVNVDQFLKAFEPYVRNGHAVLYVGMSGGVSGTANAARLAAEELREKYPEAKISTIDTYAASMGEGLQVMRASELIKSGMEFEDVVNTILDERQYMSQYFTVDDLQYLRKGGRISGTSAVIGNILSIKPILTGDPDGHIVLHEKVRGSRMALKNLADKYDKLCSDKSAMISIAHADNPEGTAALLELLKGKGLTGECITVCYEPVTGSHVGPGTIALFFKGIHK
ncbi:MAG: DegV family protein [Lachnospiraceae bacterium]|nr:DegV family protein [Lachnospiraceae bacterium]